MPKRSNDESRTPARAAAVVFALLVLATVAAFAYAQRVKRDPLVLDRVSFVGFPVLNPDDPRRNFTPNGDCRLDEIKIRFRVTQSNAGTVQVIKPGGRVVFTLARDKFLKRYTFFDFYWDGRQRGGGTAPPGRYKLRVKLGSERTLVAPGAIRLHRVSKKTKSRCVTEAGSGGLGAGPKP
jgi:hypothetical protein